MTPLSRPFRFPSIVDTTSRSNDSMQATHSNSHPFVQYTHYLMAVDNVRQSIERAQALDQLKINFQRAYDRANQCTGTKQDLGQLKDNFQKELQRRKEMGETIYNSSNRAFVATAGPVSNPAATNITPDDNMEMQNLEARAVETCKKDRALAQALRNLYHLGQVPSNGEISSFSTLTQDDFSTQTQLDEESSEEVLSFSTFTDYHSNSDEISTLTHDEYESNDEVQSNITNLTESMDGTETDFHDEDYIRCSGLETYPFYSEDLVTEWCTTDRKMRSEAPPVAVEDKIMDDENANDTQNQKKRSYSDAFGSPPQ